jgi:putative DNA primase/helicase
MGHFLNSIQENKQMNSHGKNFAKFSSSERLSAEDRAAINKSSLKNLVAFLTQLLPGGVIRGREYVVRNPRRADKKAGSFKIVIKGEKAGVWSDFATGDKGGDVISLVVYIKDCSREEAARFLLRLLSSRHAQQTAGDDPEAREHARASGSGKRNSVGSRSASAIEVLPPPPDAEAPILALRRLGLRRPDKSWSYRLEDGSRASYVLRWDNSDGSKDIRPLSYCRWSGGEGWRLKAWTDPRPLYHLDEIARNPSASILVCEGEKSADAAARVYGRSVVTTTSSGGAGSAAKTDWTPLAGRKVRIWPDADEAGLKYAERSRAS